MKGLSPLRDGLVLRAASLSVQTAQVCGIRAAGLGLALLSTLALTHWLGLHAYGDYVYITSWIGLLAIPSEGMATLALRESALARLQGSPEQLGSLIRWALGATLRISGALALAGVVALWYHPAGGCRDGLWAPILGLAGVPLACLVTLMGGVFVGLGRIRLPALLGDIITPCLMLLWIGACAWVGVRAGAGAAFAGRLSILLVLLATYGCLLPPLGAQGKAPVPDPRTLWRRSLWPLTLGKSVGILSPRIPLLLLGWMLGPGPVALFALALRFAQVVPVLLPILSTTTAPRLAQLHARRDYAGMQRLVTRSTLVTSAWGLPVAACLMLGGSWLLGWFGAPFRAGYPILLVLVTGKLVDALTGTVGQILTMGGQERWVAGIRVFGLTLTALLCLVLIPKLGALGAAIGYSTGLVIWNLLLVLRIHRRWGLLPLRPGSLSGRAR